MKFNNINCVIFDFADTLCSEHYFKALGAEYDETITELVFGDENKPGWANPWMRGELTSKDICKYLSNHLPFSSNDIYEALYQGCSQLNMNPAIFDFAKALADSEKATALVTINADIFSQVVVPENGLDSLFDVIVNSADMKESDKSKLIPHGMALSGPDITFGSSLLIDDSPIVDWFAAQGGYIYKYVDDASFEEWLKTI